MQGRKNRDGSAAAEPEPRGGTGPITGGSQPPHAQNPGRTASVETGERDGRSQVSGGPATPEPAAAKAKATPGPGPRIALRNWRISTRLVALLTLPVVAATSLGALRISESLDDIQQLDNMKLLTEMTKQATDLASALQEERDQSAGPLSNDPKATSDFSIKAARQKTDRARGTFLESTTDIEGESGSGSLNGVREHAVQIASELINLNKIRQSAYASKTNSSQTVEAYARIIEQLLSLSTDMAQATSSPEMIQRTRALAAFSSAKEYASEQRAVIAAALPPNSSTSGKLSEVDRQYASAAQDNQSSELDSFKSVYGEVGAQELLKPLDENNATIKAADNYANRVLTKEGGIATQDKRSYKDWVDADSSRIQEMSKIELTLLNQMEQQARELRNSSEQSAIINGALILLVLGVSLVGAFVVARSMIRSLRRLQDTATKVAQDRLPELVKQLSESDPQDVDTSVESVGVHSRDEIGQVAAAFDDVHREAVRLAAEQALLRGNVNAMFTNLSRRSQGLIQRQLSLISELESREADPDQLSSLFKLDHLATRMRRNGENLLVLAGEEPGRRWTRPVPLVDVLRAAASEVEQYERIELAAVPATEVAGRVVNDLVHLLAELLENATSFSSPQTKVKVTGHALPDGRVLIEIHDTGIGLSPEDLAAINERLASPPTVDVSVSRRMGLFVVGRLSQRHGIRIQLRPSDSGGTTALVMLPVDVAQGGKKIPGQAGPGGGGPAAAQAAAGAGAARRGVAPGSGGGAAGRLNSGPGAARPQVGAGAGGPRAALPARDGGFPNPQGGPQGPLNPQGPQGPRDPGQQRGPQNPAAPQSPQRPGAPLPARAQQNPQNAPNPQAVTGSGTGVFSNAPQGPVPPQQRTHKDPAEKQGRRRPVLPARGGPRAELPGGSPAPRVPSWSDENAQPHLDAPRGHDEPDSTSQFPRIQDEHQGPGSTAEFARPDYDAPRPAPRDENQGQGTGQFVRSDVFGGAPDRNGAGTGNNNGNANPSGNGNGNGFQDSGFRDGGYQDGGYQDGGFPGRQEPSHTGQYERPQDPSGTGQYERPQDPAHTGQYGQYGRGQDPAATGQYERPQEPAHTGQYGRLPGPADSGQYARPQDPAHTGQYGQAQDPLGTGQYERPTAPRQRGGQDFPPGPRPAGQDRGVPAQQEYLPPATGPGDGRTPLYDTLETNWFHGQQGQGQHQGQAQNQGQHQGQAQQHAQDPQQGRPGRSLPQRGGQQAAPQQAPRRAQPGAAAAPSAAGQGQGQASWRQSPNDELMRQAERVRKPAAGGVTVSGLPRRVPRANLVAGTAQEQQNQTGPQVSRAPDDVRGRLTNLRRGIQQGRQAGGTGQTGSHPRPTHQQER
ncbi:nitrate- and nitrite sensing domain-containing protein [Streptomyces sp. NPDC049813]|uniref:sensor histidine kinase n=1 Tax=Streptomyces sp. NPDC049813 TaxID=3365597 RepID=UPI00378C9793